MAIINELVSQIEDPILRGRISAELEKMAKQKKFGLVFKNICRSVRRCGISLSRRAQKLL